MRAAKTDISLDMECWVDELSAAQLAAYEKVANEHNAVKNALKSALTTNEGKELFNGEVFQAYSFKGDVLQELKDATLPKKPTKVEPPPSSTPSPRTARKRPSNLVYLESSDEDMDNVPLAKRITAVASSNKKPAAATPPKPLSTRLKSSVSTSSTPSGKESPKLERKGGKATPAVKAEKVGKVEKGGAGAQPSNFRPSEITAVGGLVIGNDVKEDKETGGKETNKEIKLQGKTFPSLVVLAKPSLKVKDMSSTRSKLDSKVKLVLMLTPNKFTEWLVQEGLLKSEQKCANHRTNELKLGVYSDASKFPYTGGYVWISVCCPMRFVSVFHGSIFEGAPHPPSCILKLIYHWSCQTNIQNVVQWVKVDNVYIKGVYTWLRAVCTLAVHQKCKKLGGADKYVEVGVISLGTTSQDGQQRQVKVEVLGVLDYSEKTIRLRAVEPVTDSDRNYRKRFQTILEPLQRWVHKDSTLSIDLTVDKMTLNAMGFTNIVQAAATDSTAKHTNSAVMDYLRRIVPRMFQNTLSLLSRQMIQQFLDELVWREQFGTYALQAFNNITSHIAEQTRMNTTETLTQRLYQVATNPFKDWSAMPANYKETPPNTTPKRLKKPINEADYVNTEKINVRNIKKEKDATPPPLPVGKRRGAAAASAADDDYRPEKKPLLKSTQSSKNTPAKGTGVAKASVIVTKASAIANKASAVKQSPTLSKKQAVEIKPIKKEEDDLKGLEEMYYGVRDGKEVNYESFPYTGSSSKVPTTAATAVDCPICDSNESFDSNEKLQTHLVSHIIIDGKDHQFQCLFCLEKHASETVLNKHNQVMHPTETKAPSSSSYYCLICQQRYSSLHQLTLHLQKNHSTLELPYACQACGYRSSSHRDVVRHFYDDHKNQNFLQCPYCLDIYRFCYKGQLCVSNIEHYYMHLHQHLKMKDAQLRCQKCALSFVDKGTLKQHVSNHHFSLYKTAATIRLLLENSLLITPPKVRSHHREQPVFTSQQKLGEFFAFIDGSICAECNAEIINEDHFVGLMKCNKCNYKTSCERVMYLHASECNGTNGACDGMELPLPNEMHCVCGFSTAIGNKMAHHLAVCGHKSAYATMETAQENTVKRNMLNMLGLVRRDGETGAEGEETGVQSVDEGEAETLGVLELPPQQQDTATAEEQAPIQFGEMEAAPVMEARDGDQSYADIVEEAAASDLQSVEPPQFQISFGQPEVQQQSPNTTDIDMPLIGELTDPNTPATPQFLGDVHTPMFDAVAAAEQQHYHQLMEQPPNHQ